MLLDLMPFDYGEIVLIINTKRTILSLRPMTIEHELWELRNDMSSESSETTRAPRATDRIWAPRALKRHELRELRDDMSSESIDTSSESSDGIWALKSSATIWALRALIYDMSFASSNSMSSESSTMWCELRRLYNTMRAPRALQPIWAPRALPSPMWAPKAHRPIWAHGTQYELGELIQAIRARRAQSSEKSSIKGEELNQVRRAQSNEKSSMNWDELGS